VSLDQTIFDNAVTHLNKDHHADMLALAQHTGYHWATQASVVSLSTEAVELLLSSDNRREQARFAFAALATDRESLREQIVALVRQATFARERPPIASDNPAAVTQVLRARRTIGQPSLSSEIEPDHSKVLEAIESARWAPNHHHTEPWTFYLLDPPRIEKLGGLWAEVQVRKGAKPEKAERKRLEWGRSKGVLILTCENVPDTDSVRRKEDYAACCCAAQNLMLHLWAEGLGSKWSTAAVWEHEDFWSLVDYSQAPEHTEVVGIFFYGVPEQIPKARRAKGLAEITVNFRSEVAMP
jgi:nitroreductase